MLFEKKILVVDDNVAVVSTLKTFLEIEGYEVIVARSGAEGFKLAKEENPDLIITDFVMPNINGYHFTKMLKSDPDTSSIPVILISSKADKVGEKFKELAGVIDYLTKPFSTKELKRVLSRVLPQE